MRIKGIIIIGLVLLLSLGLYGRSATTDGQLSRNWDMKYHNANQVTMPITNFGVFGQDVRYTDSGTYWPSGYPQETYIFGAGLWVGAIKISMGAPDTLVTCGYNPSSAGHEFSPSPDVDHENDPDQIVYVSTEDNDGYGWPLKTTEGADSVVSIQDSWAVYNDMDPANHFVAENRPLNIKVEQTGYVWVGPLKEDIVFLIFRVFNVGTDTLREVYMGACADCDVGDERTGNDLLGFDPARKLAYQFQIDDETGWSHFPGIIGFRFLESPLATDTAYIGQPDGSIDTIMPGEELGMTSFKSFTIDVDPSNKIERYLVLAGYNYKEYDPNNPSASYQPWPTWDETSTGSGTYEEDPSAAGDKRFLQSSGPFTLLPGDSAQIIYAVILAEYTEDRSSIRDKSDMAQMIYDNGWIGPVPPVSPNVWAVPGFEKVTLYWDNVAEITPDKYYTYASDSTSSLYNPYYREYDFEGYNIWKSTDGTNWEKIAQFDLKDGVTLMPVESLMDDQGDWIYTVVETLGTDTGLVYMYADTGLTTGVVYHYSVTAYDWNYEEADTNGKKSFLESSQKGSAVAMSPKDMSVNVEPATVTANDNTSSIWNMNYEIIDPSSELFANEANITIEWQQPEASPYTDYRFKGYIYTTGDTIRDSLFIDVTDDAGSFILWYTPQMHEFEGGMFNVSDITFNVSNILSITSNDTFNILASDGFIDVGNYSAPMLLAPAAGANQYVRSGIYEIRWHDASGNLTAEVWDVTDENNPVQLPYNNDSWKNGWSFGLKSTVIEEEIADGDDAAKGIYFNGMLLYFNSTIANDRAADPMDWAQKPNDGDVWTISVLAKTENAEGDNVYMQIIEDGKADTIYYSTDAAILPTYGIKSVYTIMPTTVNTNEEVVDSLLENVKVVPNPYVVRNEMELSDNNAKLLFTNLPARCFIRIYTVSGDLVRILKHTDPYVGTEVWDLLTASGARVASGVYIYHIEALDDNDNRIATKVGKFAIIK